MIKKSNKTNKKIFLYDMCASGIFLSLVIITKTIFKYVDVINGFSLQIQMLFFSISIILLRTYIFKIGFLLLVPFALLAFGISGHIFFDYLLPYWGFFCFIFFESINKIIYKKSFYKFNVILICLVFNIISYLIMLFSYTTSGVVFWKVDWIGSLIINGPIVGISSAINIPIMLLTIIPLMLIDRKIHNKFFY